MRRVVAILALAALGVGLAAPSAHAHALLASSDPKAGSRLEEAPAQIAIRFTEEPERALSAIEVFDLGGAALHSGSLEIDPVDPLLLRQGVRSLAEGVYTVSWRVFSRVDGHVTAGSFAFGVRADPSEADLATPPEEQAPPLSPLEIAGRWLLFAGLALIVGAAWVGALAFRTVPDPVWRIMALASATSVAGVVVLAEAQRRAAAVGIGALLATPIGRALIARAAAIGAAVILIRVARALAGKQRAVMLMLAGVGAAAAIFAHVSAGHAGTGDRLWFKVTAQWVHVLAASVWLGGLAALVAGIRGDADEPKAHAIRRFSTVAGVALVVVLGTGVTRSLTELPALGDLWSSTYGLAIVAKATLMAVLVVMGGINRYRNVPRSRSSIDPLRRVSRAELGVAGIVLIAAAVLASATPPEPVSATEALAAAPIDVSGTDVTGTTRVELTITPGFPGPNSFTARVFDVRSGDLVVADQALLRFTYEDDPVLGGSQLTLERDEDGLYRATGGNLGVPGRWRLVLLVQSAAGSTEVPLRVATKCRAEAGATEGGPTLYNIRTGTGTAQGYTDPARSGFNEVHITFFDAAGSERSIGDGPAMFASPVEGDRVELVVRRFSKGHFVGDAQLTPGLWRFDIAATGEDGQTLRICFNDQIRR